MKTLVLEKVSRVSIDGGYYGEIKVGIPVLMTAPNNEESKLTFNDLALKFAKNLGTEAVMKDLDELKKTIELRDLAKKKYDKALGYQRKLTNEKNKLKAAIKSLKAIKHPHTELDVKLIALEDKNKETKVQRNKLEENYKELFTKVDKDKMEFSETHKDWLRLGRYYILDEVISSEDLIENYHHRLLSNAEEVEKFIKFLEARGWVQFNLSEPANEIHIHYDGFLTVKELYGE